MNTQFLLFTFFNFCLGVVYTIKDEEYRRMPHLYGLDDYDSCLQEHNGVYCVAQFELYAKYHNELIDVIKEYSQDTFRHYNHSIIERGMCVSQSCAKYITNNTRNEDLRAPLEECFNEIIFKEYKINAKLSVLHYCDRHGEQKVIQIDTLDYLVAGLFVALVIFTLIGSCYDIRIQNKNRGKSSTGNKYLLCFSVYQNFRNLIPRLPEDPRLQQLTGLHAIRTIALTITSYAHFVLLFPIFNKDPQNLEKAYDTFFHYLFFDGMMVVQIFFFLSGFLLAYFLQIQSEKKQIGWSLAPKVILLRWWRLTPVCAMMIAFKASWMRHLGSGPLWKLATTTGPTANCRSYWWSHLLYINNFMTDNKRCMLQTWHLAADTQMFILGVVVHVATRNGKRMLTILLLLILGMLAPAVHVWLYGSQALAILTPQFLRALSNDTFYYVHNRGYMNLPCFLLGMSSGYIGLNLQKKGIDLSRNKVLRFLSWWIIPLIMAVILSGRMFLSPEVRESILARMVYAATHRAVFGMLCSAMILGIICRCNHLSGALLEGRFWILTSKLSYSVYIFHIMFLYLLIGYRRELILVSFITTGYITLGAMVVSYIAAVPIYLIIEAPFCKLIQVIMEDRELRRKKTA